MQATSKVEEVVCRPNGVRLLSSPLGRKSPTTPWGGPRGRQQLAGKTTITYAAGSAQAPFTPVVVRFLVTLWKEKRHMSHQLWAHVVGLQVADVAQETVNFARRRLALSLRCATESEIPYWYYLVDEKPCSSGYRRITGAAASHLQRTAPMPRRNGTHPKRTRIKKIHWNWKRERSESWAGNALPCPCGATGQNSWSKWIGNRIVSPP